MANLVIETQIGPITFENVPDRLNDPSAFAAYEQEHILPALKSLPAETEQFQKRQRQTRQQIIESQLGSPLEIGPRGEPSRLGNVARERQGALGAGAIAPVEPGSSQDPNRMWQEYISRWQMNRNDFDNPAFVVSQLAKVLPEGYEIKPFRDPRHVGYNYAVRTPLTGQEAREAAEHGGGPQSKWMLLSDRSIVSIGGAAALAGTLSNFSMALPILIDAVGLVPGPIGAAARAIGSAAPFLARAMGQGAAAVTGRGIDWSLAIAQGLPAPSFEDLSKDLGIHGAFQVGGEALVSGLVRGLRRSMEPEEIAAMREWQNWLAAAKARVENTRAQLEMARLRKAPVDEIKRLEAELQQWEAPLQAGAAQGMTAALGHPIMQTAAEQASVMGVKLPQVYTAAARLSALTLRQTARELDALATGGKLDAGTMLAGLQKMHESYLGILTSVPEISKDTAGRLIEEAGWEIIERTQNGAQVFYRKALNEARAVVWWDVDAAQAEIKALLKGKTMRTKAKVDIDAETGLPLIGKSEVEHFGQPSGKLKEILDKFTRLRNGLPETQGTIGYEVLNQIRSDLGKLANAKATGEEELNQHLAGQARDIITRVIEDARGGNPEFFAAWQWANKFYSKAKEAERLVQVGRLANADNYERLVNELFRPDNTAMASGVRFILGPERWGQIKQRIMYEFSRDPGGIVDTLNAFGKSPETLRVFFDEAEQEALYLIGHSVNDLRTAVLTKAAKLPVAQERAAYLMDNLDAGAIAAVLAQAGGLTSPTGRALSAGAFSAIVSRAIRSLEGKDVIDADIVIKQITELFHSGKAQALFDEPTQRLLRSTELIHNWLGRPRPVLGAGGSQDPGVSLMRAEIASKSSRWFEPWTMLQGLSRITQANITGYMITSWPARYLFLGAKETVGTDVAGLRRVAMGIADLTARLTSQTPPPELGELKAGLPEQVSDWWERGKKFAGEAAMAIPDFLRRGLE